MSFLLTLSVIILWFDVVVMALGSREHVSGSCVHVVVGPGFRGSPCRPYWPFACSSIIVFVYMMCFCIFKFMENKVGMNTILLHSVAAILTQRHSIFSRLNGKYTKTSDEEATSTVLSLSKAPVTSANLPVLKRFTIFTLQVRKQTWKSLIRCSSARKVEVRKLFPYRGSISAAYQESSLSECLLLGKDV